MRHLKFRKKTTLIAIHRLEHYIDLNTILSPISASCVFMVWPHAHHLIIGSLKKLVESLIENLPGDGEFKALSVARRSEAAKSISQPNRIEMIMLRHEEKQRIKLATVCFLRWVMLSSATL